MEEITPTERGTLDHAINRLTKLTGVQEFSRSDVWATFKIADERTQTAISAALEVRGVVIHKVDRRDGALSIVLDEYKNEV